MQRRTALKILGATGLAATMPVCLATQGLAQERRRQRLQSHWSYGGWGGYTANSDDGWRQMTANRWGPIPPSLRLNEQFSMRELAAIVAMKQAGAKVDYYILDGGWADPDGGLLAFKQEAWPAGPERWLAACATEGLKPGLWLPTNTMWEINVRPEWQDSLSADDASTSITHGFFATMSMFEGSYLRALINAMEHWYAKGFRYFIFDMNQINAATSRARSVLSLGEIRRRNVVALSAALARFREDRPDVVFNGTYLLSLESSGRVQVDVPAALDTFGLTGLNSEYRVSDMPHASFWRSMDINADIAAESLEAPGLTNEDFERFDSSQIFLSTSWYGNNRRKSAWKGMVMLGIARPSRTKRLWGSLSVLSEEDARWLAKVQDIYAPFLEAGSVQRFGGSVSQGEPYGYCWRRGQDAVCTVMNPAQATRYIDLPHFIHAAESPRLLFRDSGFEPMLDESRVRLGAGQLATIGFGRYADQQFDLGQESDVHIPQAMGRLNAQTVRAAENALEMQIAEPIDGSLRIVLRYFREDGTPYRGAMPGRIEAYQNGRQLPVRQHLLEVFLPNGARNFLPPWCVGEVSGDAISGDSAITVKYSLEAPSPVRIVGEAYSVWN